MAGQGFYDSYWRRWIGPKPWTPEEEAAIEARNLAYAAAEAARRAEEARPAAEHVRAVKAELLGQLPGDLARAVLETAADAKRARFVVTETERALREHLSREPQEEAELDDWIAKRQALEMKIPFLRKFADQAAAAAGVAVEAARQSIKPACVARQKEVTEGLRQFLEDVRKADEAARQAARLDNEGIARATNLTADDLAELAADSGQPANDKSKRKAR